MDPRQHNSANDFVYTKLVDEAVRRSRRSSEECLVAIEKASNFAWKNHPGRFSDGRLENLALQIGQSIRDSCDSERYSGTLDVHSSGSLRILHVASSVHSTGGHSRVLAKWIHRDLANTPSLVFTRQSEELPAFLKSVLNDRKVDVTLLNPSESRLERSKQLRHICQRFDRIILHTHPDDTIPVVALASNELPPVGMFNHAHFWFSLGTTVSDLVINTHEYFRNISEKYRGAKKTTILRPCGPQIEQLCDKPIDKIKAKQELGISPETTVFMSVGHAEYFEPADGYDFFATIGRVLASDNTCLLVVAGPSESDIQLPDEFQGRIRLLGRKSDLSLYYRATDIFLESFPFPSLGALIESVAVGEAFPVPAYGQGQTIRRVSLPLISQGSYRAEDEPGYRMYVNQIKRNAVERCQAARQLRQSIIDADRNFGEQFPHLYQELGTAPHTHRKIPATVCEYSTDNLEMAATSVTKPIDALSILPFRHFVRAQLSACFRGYQGCSGAWLNITAKARTIING